MIISIYPDKRLPLSLLNKVKGRWHIMKLALTCDRVIKIIMEPASQGGEGGKNGIISFAFYDKKGQTRWSARRSG